MKLILPIALIAAAGATAFAADASAPAAPAAKGRVVFVGAIPDGHTGAVKFKGDKPDDIKPLTIEASKSEGCVHDGSVDNTNRSLLIGENGGLANVVVMVEVEAKAPDAPFKMDQKSCRFEPHVSVVAEGTMVEFLNSDEVSHNVHTSPRTNEAINKIIASGAKESQKLDKSDQIEIKCDVHPWMNSWLIVTDAPFFAVTNEKGEFHIDGLPAGKHDVEFWHELLGKNKGEIEVAEDGSASLDLEWGMEETKSGGRGRRR